MSHEFQEKIFAFGWGEKRLVFANPEGVNLASVVGIGVPLVFPTNQPEAVSQQSEVVKMLVVEEKADKDVAVDSELAPTANPEKTQTKEKLERLKDEIKNRKAIDDQLMPLLGFSATPNEKGVYVREATTTETQNSNYQKYKEQFFKLPKLDQKIFAAVTQFHETFLAELKTKIETPKVDSFVDKYKSYITRLNVELGQAKSPKAPLATDTPEFARFVASVASIERFVDSVASKEHPAQPMEYYTWREEYRRAIEISNKAEAKSVSAPKVPESDNPIVEKLLSPSVVSIINRSIEIKRIGRATETGYHKGFQKKMLDSLVEVRAKGPDIWFNSITDLKEGTWPRTAFDAYSATYKDWKVAESAYNKVEGLSTIVSTEIATLKTAAKSKEEAVNKALDTVEVAINEHFLEEDRILERFEAELIKRATDEYQKYDFPDDVDFTPDYSNRPLVMPKSALQLNYGFAGRVNLSIYLKSVPTRVFKSDEDLRNAIKDDKKIELGTLLRNVRGSKSADYQTMNDVIYLRNILLFSDQLKNSFGLGNFIQEERIKAYARPLESLTIPAVPKAIPELRVAR